MPERKILSENIRNLRKHYELSQYEFAEECGINKDTIGKIEREIANPTLEILQLIASYSGYTVSELLSPIEGIKNKS